jgi:hypothetical protein
LLPEKNNPKTAIHQEHKSPYVRQVPTQAQLT